MSSALDRTKLSEAILALIERKRTESGNFALGTDIEEFLLDAYFQELEAEILLNPTAFEPRLLRRRRGDN